MRDFSSKNLTKKTDKNNSETPDAGKKRRPILDVDGPVMTFLTKTGEMIILSIVFLALCIPVITIGASCSALYFAVVKNIRHSRGYPVQEFWKCFKRTFKNSTFVTLVLMVVAAAMYMLIRAAVSMESTQGSFLLRVYTVLLVVVAGVTLYVFPVISRFSVSAGECVGLAFLMAGRGIGYTVLMLLMAGGLIYLYIYYIPLLTILLLPSLWTLISSFMIERVMRRYMPEPGENDEMRWYYE